MTAPLLSPEDVALLIRARKILKDKGLPRDADVKSICEAAGVSRKTGYQWAASLKPLADPCDTLTQELSELKAQHKQLKERYQDLETQNEGHRLAWKIHRVDEMLAEKKNIIHRTKKKKR